MSLKKISFKDEYGRHKVVLLPEEESEENAAIGVPVGPPDLSELGLPAEMEIRLNNELFYRGILTPQDALKKRPEVSAAIQSVLKLDTERIVTIYAGKDYRNGRKESPEIKSDSPVRYRRQGQSTKHA
jgi:hypothetical protein